MQSGGKLWRDRSARSRLASLAEEQGGVFDHVRFDGIEVVDDMGELGVTLAQRAHLMADRDHRRFAVERAQLIAVLLVPLREFLEVLLQLALQSRDVGLNLLLLILWQFAELFWCDDFVVAHRGKREAGGRADEADVFGAGVFPYFFEYLFLTVAEFLIDNLPPVTVIVAFEDCGNAGLEVLDQLLHVAPQRVAEAGRQAKRFRFVALFEIVDVAPVGGRGLGGGGLAHHAHDHRVAARGARTHDENVVSVALDADAEAHRL